MKIELEKELLKETLDKLLEYEHALDWEFGSCHTKEELIKNGMLPDCYYKIKELINED